MRGSTGAAYDRENERVYNKMKECEWCGDDFRGKAEVFEGHVFCCADCMNEWRKDVLGETAAAESEKSSD